MKVQTKEQIVQWGEELVIQELLRARVKFPMKTNSPHEGFAVLKEEVDELKDEMHFLKEHLKDLWIAVKNDELASQHDELERISDRISKIIYEAVQVGAMALKWKEDLHPHLTGFA